MTDYNTRKIIEFCKDNDVTFKVINREEQNGWECVMRSNGTKKTATKIIHYGTEKTLLLSPLLNEMLREIKKQSD